MDIFKNKYYKVFSLSIFITKCDEKEVTFKKIDHLNICKTYIDFNEKDNILEEKDEILYQNGQNYTVNKYFEKNEDIITDRLYDLEEHACQKDDIIEFLKSYKYLTYNVYKEKNQEEKFDNYDLDTEGFDKKFYFYLYFYKKLYKKIKLSNKVNPELDIKQNKITTKDIIKKIDDINKIKGYREKIYKIIKIFCPEIQSSADKIISINKIEINKNKKNDKLIFKNFIEELDEDDKVINIVLDDYYFIEIKDVLLSKNGFRLNCVGKKYNK